MVEISAKIRPSLIALNVGDEISFPMSRQYTTKTDRINHIIKVKRIL